MSAPDSAPPSDGQQPSPKRSWFTRSKPSPTPANPPTDASTTTPADPPTDPRRPTPADMPVDPRSTCSPSARGPWLPNRKTYNVTFNYPQGPPPATSPTDETPPPANPESKSRPSITEAVASIKPDDLLSVHQTPCAQSGFLTGISAGMGVGGLRWVMGLPLPRAANWAVGVGVAAAAAQYEYCQMRRRIERANMVRMVKVYTAKKGEERAERKSAREEGGETKPRRWGLF